MEEQDAAEDQHEEVASGVFVPASSYQVNEGIDRTSEHQSVFTFETTLPAQGGLDGFSMPHDEGGGPVYDEDGDLIVLRRRKRPRERRRAAEAGQEDAEDGNAARRTLEVRLLHRMSTSLDMVGLQVWKGSLLLCDLVMHLLHQRAIKVPTTVLEVGAGSGLASILGARAGALLCPGEGVVLCTDWSPEVLELAQRNAEDNGCLVVGGNGQDEEGGGGGEAAWRVLVRQLDWRWESLPVDEGPPASVPPTPPTSVDPRFAWRPSDAAACCAPSMVVLAGDVVYDDGLTPHLFRHLRRLLLPHPQRRCYLSLEKRWVFSIADMAVVAHGYRAFRAEFEASGVGDGDEGRSKEVGGLVGRLLPLADVPQYCCGYDRGSDMELWEIRAAAEGAQEPEGGGGVNA